MAPFTTLVERLLARAGALEIEIHERPLALRKTRMRGAALAAKDEMPRPMPTFRRRRRVPSSATTRSCWANLGIPSRLRGSSGTAL